MDRQDFMDEIAARGYLRASVIIPAHMMNGTIHPEIIIPEEAYIQILENGDAVFNNGGKKTFNTAKSTSEQWTGMIYQKNFQGKECWARIVSYRDNKPQIRTLRDFPSEGVCWEPTGELYLFLQNKYSQLIENKKRGVAWSPNSCWSVETMSAKAEYKIEELQPFFPKRNAVYPVTPEECYFPDKWYIKTDKDNAPYLQQFLESHKEEWGCYNTGWQIELDNYFHYPPSAKFIPAHSELKPQKGYTQITTEEFKNKYFNFKTFQNEKRRTNTGNSYKVQGSTLSVSRGSTIRTTGLRCPGSQITIGSGHSPNKGRSCKG